MIKNIIAKNRLGLYNRINNCVIIHWCIVACIFLRIKKGEKINMKDYLRKDQVVHFLFPINGDCVNCNDGREEGDNLYVTAKICAPQDADLYVNDKKAVWNGECFEVELNFTAYRTALTAIDKKSGEQDVIYVFRFRNAQKKFRISVDDNIKCFKDIYDNQDKYKSIFDNPYLNMYKKAHDATGACIHLNLFFSNETYDIDSANYFDLTMMPDKYKAEWEANSDWLRLSFHAKTNEPLWPYKNTDHTKITEECMLVHNEILRFAGKKSLAPETTLHFGSTNITGVRALRTLGYEVLGAYFEFDTEGNTMVSYHYPKDLVSYLGNRDFWVDTEEDMIYVRIDRVLNIEKTVEGNLEKIKNEVLANPTRSQFVELMIHEQYFHKDFYLYIPDFDKIIMESCKLLKAEGYEPTFLINAVKN